MNRFKIAQATFSLMAFVGSLVLQVAPVFAGDLAAKITFPHSWNNQTVVPGVQEWVGDFNIVHNSPQDDGGYLNGDRAAAKITLKFFSKTQANPQCKNNPVGQHVRTVVKDVKYSENDGHEPLTWDGTASARNVAPGSYCYEFTAKSVLRTDNYVFQKKTGSLTVAAAPSTGGSTGGNTGGQGGTGIGGTNTGSTYSLGVNPINLNLREGPSVTSIEYRTLVNVRESISVVIEDDGGRVVNNELPFFGSSFNGIVLPAGDSLSVVWDATCGSRTRFKCQTHNSKVATGDYRASVYIGGRLAAFQMIHVDNDENGPRVPAHQKFANISVAPLEINPRQSEATTFNFNVVKDLESGLTIKITDGSGRTVHSDVFRGPSPLTARSTAYSAIWNGTCRGATGNICLSDGFVKGSPNGTPYNYVMTAEGEQIAEGVIRVIGSAVIVQPPQPPQPPVPPRPPVGSFVLNDSIFPTTPFVGQGATVSMQTNRPVDNLRVTIQDQFNITRRRDLVVSPQPFGPFPAANYSAAWDGNLIEVTTGQIMVAPAGTYTYEIKATNENPVTRVFQVIPGSIRPPVGSCNLTTSSPSRTVFSAKDYESINFKFRVDRDASVTAIIRRNGQKVKTLLQASNGTNNVFAGEKTLTWYGDNDAGNLLKNNSDNGVYTLFIDVANGNNCTSQSSSVNVEIKNNNSSSNFVISKLSPSKNPFDPKNENTYLRYHINREATINITLNKASNGQFVTKLLCNSTKAGDQIHLEPWTGRNESSFCQDDGSIVSEGFYRYIIEGRATNGDTDSVAGEIEVRYDNGSLVITDLGPTKNTFDPSPPKNETTTFRFRINDNFSNIDANIELRRGGTTGTILGTIPAKKIRDLGSELEFEATWNGKDSQGRIVENDTYAYKIIVRADGKNGSKSGFVRVDKSTQSSPYCAGFRDVQKTDSICPAVEFVVSLGIFLGDSGNNTLRLNDKMTRVEAAAVTQRAFDYPLASYNSRTDGNLGHPDLTIAANRNEWYMPYIKTYTMRGILTGFKEPGNPMRPTKIMWRTEIYRMFTEAALQGPEAITNFRLPAFVTWKPFIDTPAHADTQWYLPYADFAQKNQLVAGNVFGSRSQLTRREMILLIYNTHQKGLITYTRDRTTVVSN
jgi:flagellar hook assembly protein FlgD